MKRIALSSASTTWTPPSLDEGKSPPSFTLREPTEGEMDRLATELFMRNCVPVEQNTLRATMIDEIYKLYDEAKADEAAGALEHVWNSETEHNQRVALWMEQERERLRDIKAGAPVYPTAEYPKPSVPIRIQSQAQLVRDDINGKSERLRQLTVQSINYEAEQKSWTMRLYILGWSGGIGVPCKKDESGEALTEECLDALCAKIGAAATREIYYYINSMFNLTSEEVGNSGSPANSGTDQTPSPAPSDASESSDGGSTTSSTGPTPSEE